MAHYLDLTGLQTLWSHIVAKVTNMVELKANLASPALTGTPTAPTAASGTNSTQIATTSFVQTAVGSKANTASPALTGTPTAPTPSYGDNSTKLATTAFVQEAVLGGVTVDNTTSGYTIQLYDNTTLKGILTPDITSISYLNAGNAAIGAARIVFGSTSSYIGTEFSSLFTLRLSFPTTERVIAASGVICLGGVRRPVGIQIGGSAYDYLYFRDANNGTTNVNTKGTIQANDYVQLMFITNKS